MKKTRYAILGLLQEGDLSGAELKRIIRLRLSFFWQESSGRIFPELTRLMADGSIEAVDAPENGNFRRDRVTYRLTDSGREEWNHWMESDNEKASTRNECLLKLFLSTDRNAGEIRRHLTRFLEESEQQLGLLQIFEKQLMRELDRHENHRQILAVLDLGIRQNRLYVDWCKERLSE